MTRRHTTQADREPDGARAPRHRTFAAGPRVAVALALGLAAIALVLQFGGLPQEDEQPTDTGPEPAAASTTTAPSQSGGAAQEGWLTVENVDLDLGKVTQDKKVTRTLTLSNVGDGSVTIYEVKSS